MNEQPEVHTIEKSVNNGFIQVWCSFCSLGIATGLILVLGMTGLTLSGCSGSDDGEPVTTTGGTTTYSGSGTITPIATYTFGEDNSERVGHAVGTGVFAGGEQQGPVGQMTTVTKVISLPLRPDQLPGQTQGDIRGVADLGHAFTESGNNLLVNDMLTKAAAEQK
ncbi:MAG TPA: hypothetical protein DEB25_08550 [Desulfobulbaceae bacterium]|nr:hypothetical protein [Desulfobulbaceae bacterium]